MTREEIIMALICCAEGKTEWCDKCPLKKYEGNCCAELAREALTELKASEVKLQELTAEFERLKRSYKIAVQDNADTCQLLFKAEDENKRLTEEVEILKMKRANVFEILEAYKRGSAEAVRDMAKRLKQRRESRGEFQFELVSFDTIDEITLEMIGEEK